MEYQCFIVRYYERKDGCWTKCVSICDTISDVMDRTGRICESDYLRLDTIEACY